MNHQNFILFPYFYDDFALNYNIKIYIFILLILINQYHFNKYIIKLKFNLLISFILTFYWNENAIFFPTKICVIHYDALELIIFILDRIFMFVQVSNFDHKQHDFDHEFLYYIQRSFRCFFNRFENYNEK